MSAIITRKYEQWAAGRTAQNLPARPDTFVFAYIPGQDPEAEISRDELMPPPASIVYSAPVMQYGMLNTDAVVFSVVMDTTVGESTTRPACRASTSASAWLVWIFTAPVHFLAIVF